MTAVETVESEVVEQTQNLSAIRQHEAVVARHELSVEDVVAQHDKIIAVMNAVMRDGIHYGVIPGVTKPSLLKPGAEAINVALRLAPDYESEKIFTDDGHLIVTAKCTLRHIPTGLVIASGEGLCSTRESKYAWRQGKRRCPDCGAEAIVRSTRKSAYFCISNEGGCGNRFPFSSEKARRLDEQDTSKVPNPDLADQWNTVLKMADKRALIAAVLNGTAASDVFTQDVEDLQSEGSAVQAATAQDAPTLTDNTQEDSATRAAGRDDQKPRNWKQLEAFLSGYDEGTLDAWREFQVQARKYLIGDEEKPSADQKKALFDVCAAAAVKLVETAPPAEFPPPARLQMAAAWALAFGEDIELAGPAWRMSPDEEDREARE